MRRIPLHTSRSLRCASRSNSTSTPKPQPKSSWLPAVLFPFLIGSSPSPAAAAAQTSLKTLAPHQHLHPVDRERERQREQNRAHAMAWRCSGSSNAELVENMRKAGIIGGSGDKGEEASSPQDKAAQISALVHRAMLGTDRGSYCPRGADPYEDAPQRLGLGTTATISAPHMHAHALETLGVALVEKAERTEGSLSVKILDVGCGSGYLLGAFARMGEALLAEKTGGSVHVLGIDYLPQLVKLSAENLGKSKEKEFIAPGGKAGVTIEVRQGDGWAGAPDVAGKPGKDGGGFDIIHVGAGAAEMPQKLVDQLAPGGRMVIPVDVVPNGGIGQEFVLVERDSGDPSVVKQKSLFGVNYVPLVKLGGSGSSSSSMGAGASAGEL